MTNRNKFYTAVARAWRCQTQDLSINNTTDRVVAPSHAFPATSLPSLQVPGTDRNLFSVQFLDVKNAGPHSTHVLFRCICCKVPARHRDLVNPALGLARPYQSRQLPTASSRALKSALPDSSPTFAGVLRRYLLADGFVLALVLAFPGLTQPEATKLCLCPCGPPNQRRQSSTECPVRNLSSHTSDTCLLRALETLLPAPPARLALLRCRESTGPLTDPPSVLANACVWGTADMG